MIAKRLEANMDDAEHRYSKRSPRDVHNFALVNRAIRDLLTPVLFRCLHLRCDEKDLHTYLDIALGNDVLLQTAQ